jgi:hypothetical protein
MRELTQCEGLPFLPVLNAHMLGQLIDCYLRGTPY